MVLDVNSGSVHVVDDCVYDVLSCMNEGKNAEEAAEALSSKYAEQDITEAREEIQELTDNGMLFTKDIYENAIDQFSNRPTVVKALCLHIALIISDPGVYRIAMEVCPEIERHISTQANNTNYGTYQFWYEQGAKRVVTARELSLAEIKEIREHIPEEMEIETFIHGAMCISYSGRCLLSNYFTGRDANQGACTHPCRWKYAVVEESRPGEYLPVYENERGTYIFNSKDLCMIEHIPDLLDAGIDSYKIEGRMKTALYVATVARTYRKAIDDYLESPKKYEENMEWYRDQISNCTYRQFTTGFFYGKPDHESQIYDSNTYVKEYTYLGIVGEKNEKSRYAIEQRNKFSVGEEIEVMKPDGENVCVTVKGIWDDEGNQMESAPHPKQKLWIDLGVELDRFDILRRKEME